MKILLYLDPWIDISDQPEFKLKWFDIFLSRTIRNTTSHARLIKNVDLETKVLYSDVADSCKFKEKYQWIDFVFITQRELKDIFANYDDYIVTQRKENDIKFEKLNKIILQRLGGFNPDIIILNCGVAKHLKHAFPNSLIIFYENGIFSRQPYPPTLYFDCCSSMDESFLLKNKNSILSYDLGKEGEYFLSKIRNFFLKPIKENNPFVNLVKTYRNARFSKIVLLSLQHFQSHLFRTSCEFKDQIEYLEYIFDNIDEDIGVIVTEHSLDRILNYGPIYTYFKNKYKNFIYLKETEISPNSSQFLLQLVDGIITVSSTVGLQAMLFKKPLFVPSKTSYLTAFCDEQDVSKIATFLKNDEYKTKDGALYWLITKYYVTGGYFKSGEWFYNFLKRSLDKFKKGIDFSFYEKIDNDENLLNNICNENSMKNFIKQILAIKSRVNGKNIYSKKESRTRKLKNSIKKRMSFLKNLSLFRIKDFFGFRSIKKTNNPTSLDILSLNKDKKFIFTELKNNRILWMGHSFYLSKVFNNTKENNDNLDLKKFDNLVFWGIRGFNRFKLVKDFHKKVLIAEDGFIRSILTPADKMVSENKIVDKFYLGHSVIFDDLAPHFVAKYQTRIEQKLNSNFMLSESELARSRKCIKKIVENNITKYNFQDLEIKNLPGNNDKKVLIIDQTAVDASIKYSNLLPSTYTQILQDAISENPNSDIIIKIHPDSLLSSNSALAGFYNEENTKFKNVYLYSEIVNPISLIKKVDKVYVGSSGVGMEAILCGKKVFCYGAPFYAGWGLTEDRNALFVGEFFKERRSKIRTTEEVFYIFYIWYTNYVNSKNKESCELEEIIDLIIDYRREFWNTL